MEMFFTFVAALLVANTIGGWIKLRISASEGQLVAEKVSETNKMISNFFESYRVDKLEDTLETDLSDVVKLLRSMESSLTNVIDVVVDRGLQ